MASSVFKEWRLEGQKGIESLVCGESTLPTELQDHEVLIKIHAASLNYRDLAIAKVRVWTKNNNFQAPLPGLKRKC